MEKLLIRCIYEVPRLGVSLLPKARIYHTIASYSLPMYYPNSSLWPVVLVRFHIPFPLSTASSSAVPSGLDHEYSGRVSHVRSITKWETI